MARTVWHLGAPPRSGAAGSSQTRWKGSGRSSVRSRLRVWTLELICASGCSHPDLVLPALLTLTD